MDRLIYRRKLSPTLRRLIVTLFKFARYCLTAQGFAACAPCFARFVLFVQTLQACAAYIGTLQLGQLLNRPPAS
jgi:hypothetical protein